MTNSLSFFEAAVQQAVKDLPPSSEAGVNTSPTPDSKPSGSGSDSGSSYQEGPGKPVHFMPKGKPSGSGKGSGLSYQEGPGKHISERSRSMNATELYEDLVYKLTDALLDEAIKFNTRGIQGIRIGADEAGPRRPAGGIKPRDERDISDAAKAEHARLKGMLDSNTATRKDGTTFPMPKGLRDKIEGQFNALQSMLGLGSEPVGRDAAKAKLDSIMAPDDKPETPEPTGADAFHALFRS